MEEVLEKFSTFRTTTKNPLRHRLSYIQFSRNHLCQGVPLRVPVGFVHEFLRPILLQCGKCDSETELLEAFGPTGKAAPS